MFDFRFQMGWLGKRMPALAAVMTVSLFAGSVSVMAVPLIRSVESSESGSPKERCEDPTFTSRIQHERQFLQFHRGVAAFLQPTRPALGHAQRPVLAPLPGHRLTNGLLAPITC
jgi:hypothetical protein